MKIKGQVILKKGREASARRFHPWIFSGAIHSMEGNPQNGDWVEVQDVSKLTLGFGHFQQGSISVRLLTFSSQAPGEEFYARKIQQAWSLRTRAKVINEFTNCYRLVHGEGDLLPGLIVDMYNGVAVLQAHSDGMQADRELIAEALKEVGGNRIDSIYYKRVEVTSEKAEGEYLFGMSALPHVVLEHGHKFYVDWEIGQKTGFFLDQRENRRLFGGFANGLRVLNTFCYTGGFSVYAASAGAEFVHSVDSSERAIEFTKKNLELNGFNPATHECFKEDTFDFLREKNDQYDLIVLDPPAFAKHKEARHQAMKGYQRLNAEAMRVIRPQGIILTFSCSQVVDRQLFYDTVVSAAIQAGREIKVLHHLSQPADHPVSIYHREGEYLKGLALYVS